MKPATIAEQREALVGSNPRLVAWAAATGIDLSVVNPWNAGYPAWIGEQLATFRSAHGLPNEAPLSHRADEVTAWIERRVKDALIEQLIEATE